jgi:hypothetical protein
LIIRKRHDFFFKTQAKFLRCFAKKRENIFRLKKKTPKTLPEKIFLGITLRVTEVTAFETSEGIGERSRKALGEDSGRAVCSCYDAHR